MFMASRTEIGIIVYAYIWRSINLLAPAVVIISPLAAPFRSVRKANCIKGVSERLFRDTIKY